jgi:hypothetical protein
MPPSHSTLFLVVSERVGGRRMMKRPHLGPEVVRLTWTCHRAGRVRAYRSWVRHGSTMRICSRSILFPVSYTCTCSCGSLRFTFRVLRGFSRTRRCHDLRSNGSSMRSNLWRQRICRVELGLLGCLSLRSGCRQMSRLPWPGSSDRGKTLWIRL